jgi:hypothetical protein
MANHRSKPENVANNDPVRDISQSVDVEGRKKPGKPSPLRLDSTMSWLAQIASTS